MSTLKLSKTVLDGMEIPKTGRQIIWDASLTGFGIVLFPSGQKTAILQYRNGEHQTRRLTIGKICDGLTLDQARTIAKQHYAAVARGDDPAGKKQERRQAITVDELLDAYLNSATFSEKAESTRVTDVGRIARHVRPLLGAKIADKLTTEDVLKAKQAIAEGKTAGAVKTGKPRGLSKAKGGAGTADKSVLILRAAYAWAISERLLKENPCQGVRVAPPNQRETIFGGPDDYRRMFEALAKMEVECRMRPAIADAIRMLALTGARRGEITGLLWQHVDLTTGRVIIPPKQHKTGRKTGKPRVISLPAEAQAIIARQPSGEPTDYVFRPAKGAGGEIALGKPWAQLRVEADMPPGMVMHSLRHSLASHLAMAGASSVELMTALGHAQTSTTLRYTHFAEQARNSLAERGAAVALAGMAQASGKPAAEVIDLPTSKPKKSV